MTTTAWDQESKDELGQAIQGVFKRLKQVSSGRRERALRNLELYERRPLGGHGAAAWEQARYLDSGDDADRLVLVHSSVETAKSTIYAPQKPKPQFQTLGATWEARRVAYSADRLCEGVINQRQGQFPNVWALMCDAATDAMVTGTGIVGVFSDKEAKRIAHEVVPMVDFYVDPIEGRDPKNFFREVPISRDEIRRIYGNSVSLTGAESWDTGGYDRGKTADVVALRYAWRMPYSGEKAGRATVIVGSTVLEDDEWTCPQPPFVFLRWVPSRISFWGLGIADEAGTLAKEVSEFDYRLHVRALTASGKRIYYREGTVDEKLLTSNEGVQPIPVNSQSPDLPQESIVPPFTEAEAAFRERRIQQYWDAVGISQVSAAARREPGLSSGLALITLNDTKAGRQLTKGQAFEQAFVELAHQYIWRLRELSEDDPNYFVSWPGKRLLRQVSAKALKNLDDDTYSVTVAPASSLPHDPAGRQQMVQELYRSGIITQDTAKTLIGWPDLDSELDTDRAESEYIDALIDAYLQADQDDWAPVDYEPPERHLVDKLGAIRRFASAWFRARIDQRALPREERGKAEWNIQLLSTWMRQCSELVDEEAAQTQALQQQQQQQPPLPAAPPAMPSPIQ